MENSTLFMPAAQVGEAEFTQEPLRREILEQLDRVTNSPHFRNSKRYPALLRYLVEESVAGRSDALKERLLGLCVFDRPADYDTNLDPVVRVSAGEVRKRIAQYYQMPGNENELRMEIPLGSYVPRFYRPFAERGVEGAGRNESSGEYRLRSLESANEEAKREPAPSAAELTEMVLTAGPVSLDAPVAPARLSARRAVRIDRHLALVYGSLLLALAALGFVSWRATHKAAVSSGVSFFWGPVLRASSPALIVLGVHSFDAEGNDISAQSHASKPQPQQTLLSAMTRSDMVHLSDVTSYGAMTQLLTDYRHRFRTQGAADTTLEQLKEGPFLLIGGFNNLWTTRLTQQLRFRFVTLPGGINVVQDSLHPESFWTLNTTVSALDSTRDYGLVSCFVDPTTGQYAMMAGGIGKSGTEAAADFLTDDKGLTRWLDKVPHEGASNVQVVVATEVIEGEHGPPAVVAYHFW